MKLLEFDTFPLIASLLILFILWKIFQKDEKKATVNKIPGPFAFPIVGNIIELLESKDTIMESIMKRRKKFGPIFRMWLGSKPSVILSRAEEIEAFIKGTKNSEKSFVYKFVQPWLGTGLLTSHGSKWASRRKLITPTFHFTILQSFIEIFQENVDILIKKLEEKEKTEEEFDIYPLVALCLLDIICETAMGTKVNAQSDSQSEYVKSVYSLSSLTLQRLTRVWLHPTFIFNLSSSGRQQKKHLDIVHSFADNVIKARKKALKDDILMVKEEKLSFLDLLLKQSMTETTIPMTDKDIREEVDTFMFEGHDTTTAGVNWVIFVLGHYPEIQEEVYKEIKKIFESKQEDMLTIADLAKMKFLERVIKETLRLYPSVSSIGRVAEEDIILNNYMVPKGVNVGINIYALHRDPIVFPNPEVFDPDRFLPENSAKRHPFAYIPFSAGPRNCIGQKFAMYEEKTILANLLLKFRIESVETMEDVKKIPELVLRPKNGIKVKLYKR